MTSRRAKIEEDTYFRIKRVSQYNSNLSQHELAEILDMSVSALNYYLNTIVNKGFVKMSNFQKIKNKFEYVYLFTQQGIAEKVALTSQILKRKMDEYEALKVEIKALKAAVCNG